MWDMTLSSDPNERSVMSVIPASLQDNLSTWEDNISEAVKRTMQGNECEGGLRPKAKGSGSLVDKLS